MRVMNKHSCELQFKLPMRYVMAMRLLRWWMVMKIGFEESFPVLVISKKKKIILNKEEE